MSTKTMVVVKCSENVEGSGDNIYTSLCGKLFKEEGIYIATWSGTDPYDNMNFFT